MSVLYTGTLSFTIRKKGETCLTLRTKLTRQYVFIVTGIGR